MGLAEFGWYHYYSTYLRCNVHSLTDERIDREERAPHDDEGRVTGRPIGAVKRNVWDGVRTGSDSLNHPRQYVPYQWHSSRDSVAGLAMKHVLQAYCNRSLNPIVKTSFASG